MSYNQTFFKMPLLNREFEDKKIGCIYDQNISKIKQNMKKSCKTSLLIILTRLSNAINWFLIANCPLMDISPKRNALLNENKQNYHGSNINEMV